eukprot:CAMPEP_0184685268 /NCGR_PEP_ID=MMETSP0312-20130426/18305_1 /TAXON_ID=31354 /ORGANISM="Compsopogon coeruleus, Strain SAG 36.94" /LENGTH=333 /DNA_ID=CAMNT_0027139189 /DNA_START=125 /DNA_END=1127 /DNA_ORIENTATION=-
MAWRPPTLWEPTLVSSHLQSLRRRARIPSVIVAASDFYQILGVEASSDATVIKRAYRRLALKNHPDVSKDPNAQERFMEIQEAYNVLSDARRRAQYDRQRASGRNSGSGASSSWPFDFEDSARYRPPRQEDEALNDSLGAIFRDLLSGLKSSGASGFFEDFVEYLERQAGAGPSDPFDTSVQRDFVNDQAEEEISADLEDARFILGQLRARQVSLIQEASDLEAKAAVAFGQAQQDLKENAAGVRVRCKSIERTIAKQQDRVNQLITALARAQASRRSSTKGTRNSPQTEQVQNVSPKESRSPYSPEDYRSRLQRTQQEVDDELQRLKRELGL